MLHKVVLVDYQVKGKKRSKRTQGREFYLCDAKSAAVAYGLSKRCFFNYSTIKYKELTA